jgi:hypothetical protein
MQQEVPIAPIDRPALCRYMQGSNFGAAFADQTEGHGHVRCNKLNSRTNDHQRWKYPFLAHALTWRALIKNKSMLERTLSIREGRSWLLL